MYSLHSEYGLCWFPFSTFLFLKPSPMNQENLPIFFQANRQVCFVLSLCYILSLCVCAVSGYFWSVDILVSVDWEIGNMYRNGRESKIWINDLLPKQNRKSLCILPILLPVTIHSDLYIGFGERKKMKMKNEIEQR